MKKIVMGIAAVAMAASMFAADVSAKVVLNGDIFKVNEAGASALSAIKDDAANHQPHMALSVSGDRAGAGFKVVKEAGKAINLWLKPADFLKLSFNENALELFGDKYHGWYANNVGKVNEGYGAEIASGDLKVNLNMVPSFFSKAGAADAVIGECGVKVSYGNGDIGNIAVVADFNSNFKAMAFAAGYSNTFSGVGVVFNAGVALDDSKFKNAKINPSVGGNVDAFGYAVDVLATINGGDKTTTTVGANVSASYNIDGIGLKAYFEDADFAADTFAANIGVEVTGNIDGASWKVVPKYTTASKEFAIGYEVSMGW